MKDGSIAEKVRSNLVERLEDTRERLQLEPFSDEDVHTTRKALKQARASLRLLREGFGANEFRRLNLAVRDAARPLTPLRDANILRQALDKVVAQTEETLSAPVANRLRRALRQELGRNRKQLQAKNIAAIRSNLNKVKLSVRDLSCTRLDCTVVDDAIKRAHRNARKAFKTAKRDPSDDNLHEWRKQAKYEFNQLELLQELDSQRICATVRQTHKLSDHLGDDHDLALLHDWITAQTKPAKPTAEVTDIDVLLKAVNAMRAKLQRKARRLGESLYANKT